MTRTRLRFVIPLAVASLVLAACSGDDGDPAAADDGTEESDDTEEEDDEEEEDDDDATAGELPRAETLYTGGAQWGAYSNFNPNTPSEVSGLRGLVYETLFEFDPWSGEIQPWLAESGEWITDDVYEVTLREGITWHEGGTLTAEDVKFTFDLRDRDGVEFGALDEWLDEVEVVDDLTVQFTFSDPRYGEWDNVLYGRQIVAADTWSPVVDEIGTVDGVDQLNGTGPFTYHSHEDTRLRYERYDDWWATGTLGLEMPMRYIVDFANESNEVAVAQITQNELDLSNFFLPNILDLIEQNDDILTFYDAPPYMLSQNTASLIPNTNRAPLDDPEFRRALAFSIDVDEIIDFAYGGIVAPANPTGLLPMWGALGLVDDDVVGELGYTYDPAQAEAILDAAGYEYDGEWRAAPDGAPIELTLMIQSGWTDWEQSADIIGDGFRDIGLNIVVDNVPNEDIEQLRREGDYDLVVWNRTGRVTNHPYTHYTTYFQLPIQDPQSHDENAERYDNERAWELTQQLAKLSVGDPATQGELDDVLSELQEISLADMPLIPMWHNGLWAQVNTGTWTNWPTDADDTPDYYCATWGGVWQMGTVRCIAGLEPAG